VFQGKAESRTASGFAANRPSLLRKFTVALSYKTLVQQGFQGIASFKKNDPKVLILLKSV
jgi:hypothetical protein